MTNVHAKTTLPSQTYRVRRWLSFGLFVVCLFAFISAMTTGCVDFSRVGIIDCRTTNPFGYWVTSGIIFIISIGLLITFLSSFGRAGEEVHQQQDEELAAWLSTAELKTDELVQTARAPTLARVLGVVYLFSIVFLLWKYEGFQDWVRFSLFAFLILPASLAVGLALQWLSEEIKVHDQGVSCIIMFRWKHWPWESFSQVRLEGDYFQKGYCIRLLSSKGRLILTPNSFHQNSQKFLAVCQRILISVSSCQATIQLPADGLEAWLDALSSE